MTTPSWWSQPFPPTGAIASEGIRNQLGRPPVDPLTVFVRETGQNSWDAKLDGVETTYRLELSAVTPSRRPTWERLLAPPAHAQEHLAIGRAVRQPNLRLLSVVDRGTKGLGGPTRADEVADDRRDWVSFVLNVGEKRGSEHGGGTYGYGKAVLYRLSRVGTILVYTRTMEPSGEVSSRLIGISLGSSFDSRARVGEPARPFTGRHWWGDVQGEHVEPLIGAAADEAASALGLTSFAPGQTGTTLVVVDPDLADFDSDEEAARHLAETIAWQMWPILLPERGRRRMVASVEAGGRTYTVPDPAITYPLRLFVAAYRRLEQPTTEVLECKRPRRRLGRFAMERTVVVPMERNAISRVAAYAGVDGDPHHVCLMRSPELVVRYYEGPQPTSVHQAYAAVFRADAAMDATYARAEPPTHDNWVPDQLADDEKTFVRTTFTRLREQLSDFRRPDLKATTTAGLSLAAASNYLGGLVASALASSEVAGSTTRNTSRRTGTPGAESPGSGPEGSGRLRVKALDDPRVEDRDGQVVIRQRFLVEGEGLVKLEARLSIATWDGREDAAPAGAERPTVRSWTTPWGEALTPVLRTTAPVEVELEVLPVRDTVTDIEVDVSRTVTARGNSL